MSDASETRVYATDEASELAALRQEKASRRSDGAGASHLISLHGGTLTMKSAPGLGTTASFFLPADRVLRPITTAA